MIQLVRQGLFETNSSSTHTLTICTKDEWNKWVKGEMIYDRSTETLVSLPDYSVEALRKEYFADHIQKIQNGYIYDDVYYKTLEEIVLDESIAIDEDELEKYKHNYNLESYDSYMCDIEDMEFSRVEYTSPSGDELVGFGYGGYDG